MSDRGRLNSNEGKVDIGKSKYLLKIMFKHIDVQIISLPVILIKSIVSMVK